jgi:YHS domain-containing protein
VATVLRVLLLFVLVLLVLRAAGRFIGGMAEGARSGPRRRPADPPVKMARDPVCGTFVVPGKALSATTGGTTEWFCSETCRDTFARRG